MDPNDPHEADKLDETLMETFPASDAPANTTETGIRIGTVSADLTVRDNRDASRFEVVKDGHLSFLQYKRRASDIVLIHTEVPVALQGHGIASLLAKTALQSARAEGMPVVVLCPFVRAYLRRHPEMRTGSVHDRDE